MLRRGSYGKWNGIFFSQPHKIEVLGVGGRRNLRLSGVVCVFRFPLFGHTNCVGVVVAVDFFVGIFFIDFQGGGCWCREKSHDFVSSDS